MIEAEQYRVADSSHRARDLALRQALARERELDVYIGEHLWIRLGAFRGHARFAFGHVSTAAPQYMYDVKCGAPADAEQHQFHRP